MPKNRSETPYVVSYGGLRRTLSLALAGRPRKRSWLTCRNGGGRHVSKLPEQRGAQERGVVLVGE